MSSTPIHGLDDLKRAIADLTWDLRRKVVVGALRDAGAPMARQARQNAPTLKTAHPYRLPGTLKRSIIVRASKRFRGQNGEIGVYIAVRKRNGLSGKASARNPFDPFYWRFQEFGTRKMTANPFLGPAFNANASRAIDIFKTRLKTRIDKAEQRK